MGSLTKRHSARRIALFNHKGGVGKTTLTVNIASALGDLGARVLLVDADPQCSLTSYLIEDSVVDDLLDNSDSEQGQTIWSALKPVVEGEGSVRYIKSIGVISNNVRLLPGDIQLSEYEQELTSFWASCYSRRTRGFRGTSSLSELVNHVVSKLNIDIVLFDVGPNIGPLNRIVLLDCDYFAVPAACDLLSLRALKTLGHTLSTWIDDWQRLLQLAPEDLYVLPGKPKLLGYIAQRFRIYRGLPTAGQAHYLVQIEKKIDADIARLLKRVDADLVPFSFSEMRLARVKDFASLATSSQTEGLAIADVSDGTPSQRAEARTIFNDLAKKILSRTSP